MSRRKWAGPSQNGYEVLERRSLLSATMGPWTTLDALPAAKGLTTDLHLTKFQPYTVSAKSLANFLSYTPEENTRYGFGLGQNSRLIGIPTPDGTLARFRIVETTDAIMDPKLAAKFPSITTYAGVGVDDPTATIRLDYTPLGFHAQVLTQKGRGAYYVEPYFHNDTGVYASYYKVDAKQGKGMTCSCGGVGCPLCANMTAGTTAGKSAGKNAKSAPLKTAASAATTAPAATAARTSGTQLRTYRTAVAATGEYTAYFGGTVAAGQAAIVTAMNRVSGVYETELSIRLSLVANNSSLVYTNASTDPYTNNEPGTLLSQNQTNITSIIGNANYDIGHVFSTAGGGLASLGVVGNSSYKAQGETGESTPVGDAFYIDYVAHEMGHQFGADHTFNTTNESPSYNNNRNAATAFEPGSGSTIMAYAGIEGPPANGSAGVEDLQPNSDPYFAFVSLNQILTYVDGSIPSVGVRTSTNNSIPTVTPGTMAYTIPANTPFTLTSPTASDANGDTVYYSWEEADLGTYRYLNQADNGSSPLFRVYNPTTDPSRTFPRLASILNGTNTTYVGTSTVSRAEQLPTTSRTMKFVLTLRDQKAGGGGTNVLSGTGNGTTASTITPTATVTSVAAASTFAVSNFNTATTVDGGSQQTITWNVAGTTGNGINTSAVNILMSTDGGQTFATTLAGGTANDGSETVTIPNVSSSLVRFKVAAVGNIYFDINNANVTVTATAAPSATPAVPDLVAATDSGISSSDNVTNRNNNGPTKALQFVVGNTVSGATVNVLSDGVVIGTAAASGTSTTVTTNGTALINNGTHGITATQTESGKPVSAASAALSVIVDTIAPTITGTSFAFVGNGGPTVTFTASETIGTLTLPQFFSAGNTTTGTSVPTANLVTAFGGNTATLSFSGVSGAPSATTLTNGNYTANLNAGGFTDVAGNALAATASTTFYWLNGDANRDRTVDFSDFLALQNNFNATQRVYAEGDFNYDGKVDFSDFLILQNNFGVTV